MDSGKLYFALVAFTSYLHLYLWCAEKPTDSHKIGKSATVFDLITAHTLISAQSSSFVVFKLQPVYFFYLFLYKSKCCWYSFELQDKSRSFKCYGLALLPSIICPGRLRIASKYIFNLWQLRQRVDSLAQWLEHWISGGPGSIPTSGVEIFSAMLHSFVTTFMSKDRGSSGIGLYTPKMASRHHNDDFLETGECYGLALLPSIICPGRLRIASKYIFNLWQLRQRVDSLAQWLESWIFNREDRVRFPR